MRQVTTLACAATIGLVAAQAVGAQVVRGALVERDSTTAVAGGIVQLVDASAAVVRQTLSRADGSFVLAAPVPGSYRLRALRIGFAPSLSERFTLTAGTDTSLRLVMNGRPVVLGPVAVRAERRCAVDPDSGSEAARVWNEVRKALTAAVLSRQSRAYDVRLALYTRRLDPDGQRVTAETREEIDGSSQRPFATVAPDTLARYGFVHGDPRTGMTYYGADAALLISDDFAASHCLRLEGRDAAPRGHEDWIGLGFEPVKDALPDIAGTLWVDRRSAELRELDYRYTGVPRAARDARAGGHTEFLRLADGAWLVRRWFIQMPVLGLRIRRLGSFGSYALTPGDDERRDTIVTGMQVTGGELLALSADGAGAWRGRSNAIRGIAVDSASGEPIPQLAVTLDGTKRSTATDSSGRFSFESLFPGEYEVRVTHARPDSIERSGVTVAVTVPDSGDADVRMMIPRSTVGTSSTPDDVDRRLRGAIAARITDARTGAPLSGVELSLPAYSRIALTDSLGRVRLGNVPPGEYELRVRRLGYVAADARVVVRDSTITFDFALASGPATLDTVAVTAAGTPTYLRDVEIRRAQGNGSFLSADQLRRHANEAFDIVAVQSFAGLREVLDQSQRHHLASTRGSCGYENAESGGSQASCGASACLVQIYLDGDRLPEDQLDLVHTASLAAVEYYSGASVPTPYRGPGSACGVMLLWSKR